LKTGHIFSYILEVILAKILVSKKKDVFPIRALIEEKTHIFKRVFRLWLGLDIVSIAVKFLLSIYIPLKLGYTILVEEYIPATVSDYIYLSKIIGFALKPTSLAITFPLRLMCLGGFTQVIFLNADNETLKSRWKHRGSFDEREDYLNMQRTILLQMSRKLSSNRLIYINTGKQTPEETYQLIKKYLLN